MREIEVIKEEIEQKENAIKRMEEMLKEAKQELKKYEKYRGLKYEKYKNYGDGKYKWGLTQESFLDALRKLTLLIVGAKVSGQYIHFKLKKTAELNFKETKLGNDFLEEIYPIIVKYMDVVLDDEHTPQNDEVRE